MKPHAIRRVLWFGNIGLLAGVAAAGVHVARVHGATAAVVTRGQSNLDPRWVSVYEAWRAKSAAVQSSEQKPEGPVTYEAVNRVLLVHSKRNPRWYPFVGNPPPPEIKPEAIVVVETPKPKGLEALGHVLGIVGSRVILFQFDGPGGAAPAPAPVPTGAARGRDVAPAPSSNVVPIRVGDAIAKGDMPKIFYLEAIEPASDQPGTTDIVYAERLADGSKGPLQRARFNPRPHDDSLGAVISGGPLAGTAATQPGVAPASSAAQPGEPGASAEAAPAGPEPSVALRDLSEVLTKPVESLAIEDLQPRVVQNSDSERSVLFDKNTYEYMRSKGRAVAESIKTEEAVDRRTGQVVGIRISGMSDDAAGKVFDVQRGDILKSIDGRAVRSRAEAMDIAQGLSEDRNVTVVIERRGKDITYVVDPRDPRLRREGRYLEPSK